MQADHNPNPQRFQVFTQLPNGKGFRIKNSKYIYLFDKFGGWYDQYNNYYNADGQPEDPPSQQDDQFQRVILEDQYEQHDQDDYYDKEYGGHAADDVDYQQDHHNQHQKVLQAIAHNQTILHQYPVKTPIRVDFSNMSFKANKAQILKHYKNKIGNGILNVILTQDNGKFTGQGYFVCKQISTAQKLIKYQAQQFQGRKVYFDVQPLEESLLQPVTRQQMDISINQDDFQSLVKQKPLETKQQPKPSKKKYLSKNTTQQKKQQPKVQSTQQKTQPSKQQVKTQQKPVVQQKPQEPKKQEKKEPTWSKYYAEVTMFPKKTSFKQWMSTFGFKENEHFKNPEKIQSKDPTKKYATVELRNDVYQRIEGTMYENKKVSFNKMD